MTKRITFVVCVAASQVWIARACDGRDTLADWVALGIGLGCLWVAAAQIEEANR